MSGALFSFLFILITSLSFKAITISAQSGYLPQEEKTALQEIAYQLGKKDWDFNENPCDGNSTSWSTPTRADMPLYNNSVICNCSFRDGVIVCHIDSIFLKGQDLAGVLPASLPKLPYVKNIDLSRNYLTGTIPPEWESTKLEYMSVLVNRLSGPIPKYLGNFSTLIYMSLESNKFEGTIPAELGKLVNLENLILSDNNLTGELPPELYNLKKLTQLRLSSNNFTGKVPSFQSWANLEKLEIQGSGFEGPIPSSISILRNLTDLRISDLIGGASEFPLLRDVKNLKVLMLRSCNISGKIPSYVADMARLKNLDLSFNKLEGDIPYLKGLFTLEVMYLTNNFFTGPIPEWMKSRDNFFQIDLSYNYFDEISVPSTCQESLNLFRSFSGGNSSELGKCLRSFPCSKDWYSFHVNCGGTRTIVDGIEFEGDEESAGSTKFVPSRENWGTSSTGNFWGREIAPTSYLAKNVSVLKMNNSELYMTARLSPLSLTYYGRCLANGNYTVTLHFAEIILRDDKTYMSLGRRMFDVYIQDERVLTDFDIKQDAKGVDEVVKKTFTAVVKNRVLEIRFHYSGKGATAVPGRGTYGPLISAISVESDKKKIFITTGAASLTGKKKIFIITGAGGLALFLILGILCFSRWKGYIGGRTSRNQELRGGKGSDLQTGNFTFRQIKAATNNFDVANKIGEGGFGSVYKGVLLDGTLIAVKQLSTKSKQGNREFVNEIGTVSGLQHPNLAKLYGCCIEGSQLLLVYEFMENNSLARALFGPEEGHLKIDWPTRQRICVGIAKGLAFLHEESTLKIVHRDIKANNVLLDKDLNPKISDFGLAKLDDDDNTHISTRVAGTIGYMAPEYALWGHLTYKADVYSFGVVAIEIVAGKSNTKYRPSNNSYLCLLDWALHLQKKGRLMELVDARLGSDFDRDEAERMIRVGLLCTNQSPELRPTMSMVYGMLQGYIEVQEFNNMDSSIHEDGSKLRSISDKFEDLQIDLSETQALIHPFEAGEEGFSSTSSQQ